MKFRQFALLLGAALLAVGLCSAKDSLDQQRQKIRKMASSTLKDLYKLEPGSRSAIQESAGYAVFDNLGTNLFVVSTARGKGIAINSKTKEETFMKKQL